MSYTPQPLHSTRRFRGSVDADRTRGVSCRERARWARGRGAGCQGGVPPHAMKLHHVIEAQQFDVPTLSYLFKLTEKMKRLVARGGTSDYLSRIMATLFYEPSTRTRFSFETAMHRLGGRVISTGNAADFSSVVKGETLEDTVRILNGYVDVIVLRHYDVRAARRSAAASRVPLVNAGAALCPDPTQA